MDATAELDTRAHPNAAVDVRFVSACRGRHKRCKILPIVPGLHPVPARREQWSHGHVRGLVGALDPGEREIDDFVGEDFKAAHPERYGSATA